MTTIPAEVEIVPNRTVTLQPYQRRMMDVIMSCPKGSTPSLRVGGCPVAVGKSGKVTHAWLGGRWIKLGKARKVKP